MAASISFDNLPSKMKDYALSDNSSLLTKMIADGMGFTDYMQLLTTADEIPLTELVVSDVLQPGQKDTFNPTTNAIGFKARIGKVRPCKVDLQFTPVKIAQFYKTYLGKVKQATQTNPYDLPFEAFIFEQITKKMKENLRMKAIFNGVYNAAGTAPQDTMDGLITLRDAAITAGDIPAGNLIPYAAITNVNAVDKFNLLAEKIIANPVYGGQKMVCLTSPLIKHYYNQAFKAENGSLPYNNQFEQTRIEGTNIYIQSEIGLTGINGLTVTPEDNLFYLADDEANADSITVEKALRNVYVLIDFQAAVQFGIAELVWAMYPS